MPWMVVENDEGDQVHVVPICMGGQIITPHTLNYECVCKPDMEEGGGGNLILTHNDMIGNADAKNIH